MILSGEADVGFSGSVISKSGSLHPNAKGQLKVLIVWIRGAAPSPACVPRALYPSWTVATTPATDPRVSTSGAARAL